jgi:glutamate synthase domain-containing protein 3
MKSQTIDCKGKTSREINQEIRASIADHAEEINIHSPAARHNLGVATMDPVRMVFDGSVGYFCGGMSDGANIAIRGSAGWSVGESMMGGTIEVDGNAGNGAGAAIRGGTVVIHGDAGARAGISMKGGLLMIGGSAGYMSGFMMQKGTLIVCGDAAEGLADSMYLGTVYLGGKVDSLGHDTEVSEPTAGEWTFLRENLSRFNLPCDRPFRKIVSGRRLWNFDKKDFDIWKAIL